MATETKVKHTPGPWLHADDYITAGSYTIARIFPGTGNEDGNARLISKAPEMAELLREAIESGADFAGELYERAERLLEEIES